jgi:hypothetical protein
LNVFANKNSKLAAKACVGEECREELLMAGSSSVTVSSTDVITLSATIKAEGRRDILEIEAVIGNYGTYTTATARIVLSEIDGFTTLTGNAYEYVGFGLSDPAFQLYDIGWKSQSYYSECWATYPTVKCSFRAAYLGGIVPKDKPTKPWVGLSSWFDDKSCTPQYHYNGDDATEGCYGMPEDGYKRCYADNYYKFTTGGLHGAVDEPTGGDATRKVETKMAMARVQECDAAYLSEDDRRLLYAESPRCGQFWVGTLNNCNKNELFFSGSRTITTHTGNTVAGEISNDEMFSLGDGVVANLRSAVIKITLDNPDASELEVYLRSQTEPGYYGSVPVFSASAVTTAKNVASISVEDLAGEVGFDPEHVTGVVIRNLGSEPVYIKEIKSACDYVTSIQCKNVEYVSGGGFKVHAVVKRAENVKSYSISATENGQNVSSLSKTFSCPGATCPTGDAEGRIFLMSDVYNPYASSDFNAERSYVFSVSMKDEGGDVEGSPCTTTPVFKLQPISAECKWPTTNEKPSVPKGNGLPDFQYRLTDCAGGNCEWVVLLDGETELATGTGTVSGFTSLPMDKRTEYNTTTENALEAGDHSITITNKSGATTLFNDCSKSFTIVDGGTGNLTCTMPANVLPGQRNVNISVYSTLVRQEFDIYIDDEKKKAAIWMENGQGNYGDLTIPTALGNHTFKITKKGETEAECAGSFELEGPLQCSIKDEVKIGVQNTFLVSVKSGYSCNNCKYSHTGSPGKNLDCGYQCDGVAVGNQTFTMTNSTPLVLTADCQCGNDRFTCSRTAAAEVVAPTLPDGDCVDATINAEPSTSISFTPKSLAGCEGGCEYWVTNPVGTKITPETNATITSASSVSFPGEARSSTSTYTFHVKNAKGEKTCTIPVDYKKPSYSCPNATTAEPGTQVTVTPTNVSYCSGGCGYKITGTGIDDIEGENFTSGSLADKIVDASNPITGTDVTGGVAKKYSLTLSNAAGSGTACDVTVNYMKPTFTCPGNNDDGVVDVAVPLSLTPQYCTQGCNFTVKKGSSSGTNAITPVTNRSYKTGKLGDITESTANTYTYYVTLSNPVGSDEQNCSFDIKFTVGSGDLDCYFVENSDGTTVITGSVNPKYQVRFCVSKDSEVRQTTLTGMEYKDNADVAIEKTDFWTDNSKPACHYFVTPATEGSYPFNAKYNKVTVCKEPPILIVKKTVATGCIKFVGGVGNYDKNCYNSGLKNMAENTCYTLNTANVTDTAWPNDEADNTYWWKTTPCK